MNAQRSDYQKKLKQRVAAFFAERGWDVNGKELDTAYLFVKDIALESYRNGQKAKKRTGSSVGSALANGKLKRVAAKG